MTHAALELVRDRTAAEPMTERSIVYSPAPRSYGSGANRVRGLAATLLVYALVTAVFLITISISFTRPPPPTSLAVMDSTPPASPQDMPPKDREAPKPVERKVTPQQPLEIEMVKPISLPLATVTQPVAPETTKPSDPAPREPETAAPKTTPAPPTPRVTSKGPDSWEGRVLARLNTYRRYPREAQMRHQQGVPWIRFVMDRQGKVLSARLERSSGFAELDREAEQLPKRAQPLPKPPEDRPGDTLELVVPVEFFMQ